MTAGFVIDFAMCVPPCRMCDGECQRAGRWPRSGPLKRDGIVLNESVALNKPFSLSGQLPGILLIDDAHRMQESELGRPGELSIRAEPHLGVLDAIERRFVLVLARVVHADQIVLRAPLRRHTARVSDETTELGGRHELPVTCA